MGGKKDRGGKEKKKSSASASSASTSTTNVVSSNSLSTLVEEMKKSSKKSDRATATATATADENNFGDSLEAGDEESYGSSSLGEYDAPTPIRSVISNTVGLDEELDEILKQISDKRSSLVRVEALENLVSKLLSCLTIETIMSRNDTMVYNVLGCCRKPSIQEGKFAPRALALIGLTLGPEQEDFYMEVKPVLELLVKNDPNPSTRMEALNALSILCFICSAEEIGNHRLEMMRLCDAYLNTSCPTIVCQSALECWGLLASTQDESYLSSVVIPEWLHVFVDFLDHTELDIRSAAGENIALLLEASHVMSTEVEGLDAICDRLRALSKESSKKNKKKDRKEQRSVFRDVYRTAAEKEEPSVTLTIQDEVMTFRGWVEIKQMTAVKECLQQGFQEHIQFNALLRDILNLPEAHGIEHRQIIEETQSRSKSSKSSASNKQRSTNLRNDRQRRERAKHAFMEEE